MGKKSKNTIKSSNSSNKNLSVMTRISFKVAMYIIGAAILILVCKSTFDFGVQVYSSQGVDAVGSGKDVVVTIPANSTTGEIASILKKNGLIESELAFIIQTYLYEAEIYSGTYTLNTEFGPEELIDAIRPAETES